MLDSLEKQLPIFLKMADDLRLDTTILNGTKYAFESVKTNAAWMIFNSAYSLGVCDGQKETWELIK
jgi:hypothetical protein